MMSPGIQIINTSESWDKPLGFMARPALTAASHVGSGISHSPPGRRPAHSSPTEHSWPQGSPAPLTPVPRGVALEGPWREYREAGPSDELDTVGFGRQITQGDFKALGCLNAQIFWDHGFWVTLESAGCPEPTH